MEELQYHEQRDLKNEKKLQELLASLPPFCADFFRGIEPATSSMTRLSYAYDINMFFVFIRDLKPELLNLQTSEISMNDFTEISVTDLERYLEFLKYRPDDPDHKNTNKEAGIKRKFFSLKSFYGYFYRTGQIKTNPTLSMQVPRIREKEIVRLNQEEIRELIKEAQNGNGLSPKQKQFHEKNKGKGLCHPCLNAWNRNPCLGMRRSESGGCRFNRAEHSHPPERRKRSNCVFQR